MDGNRFMQYQKWGFKGMKLSIVLSAQPASFTAVTYKGDLDANLLKIAKMGFDGVELAIRNPNEIKLSEIKLSLKKNKLMVPAIGTGQAFGEEGLSFTHRRPDVRKAAVERILSHMEFANELGASVIIGLIRGQNCSEIGKQQAEEWLLEALNTCASELKHIKLAIEPINRYETDLLNTVAECLNFLDKLNLDNVGLLLDTFHMNIEEPSITESLMAARERLLHVHVADSNRWYPGAGHIDFTSIIRTLKKINYQSFISGEMLPLPDAESSATKMLEFLKNIINQN
jgi:sugar phosphate isomerase/epimerase